MNYLPLANLILRYYNEVNSSEVIDVRRVIYIYIDRFVTVALLVPQIVFILQHKTTYYETKKTQNMPCLFVSSLYQI